MNMSRNAPPLLSVRDLRVALQTSHGHVEALRGVNFEMQRGDTLGLIGESGCGKSLTALAVMGLLPDRAKVSGSIHLNGTDLTQLNEAALCEMRGARMAMIFQEPMTALNPAYTIGDQLTEHYIFHRRSSAQEARERAVMLLEKVGIAGAAQRLGQYPHQLSGGLRQRVMIAMALMCGPDLLIADEPSTALDVTIQAQILRLLADLQRELGIAMVLITHDLGVVARIADRVAVMYAGQIVEEGPVAVLFGQPRHPYTQGLMRCIPVPGKTPPGGTLGTIPGVVPALYGELHGCAFRDRCEYAGPSCASAIPLRRDEGSHHWRCVLDPGERTS